MPLKQTIKLLDGSTHEVDAKTLRAISELSTAQIDIATGRTSVVLVARHLAGRPVADSFLAFWNEKDLPLVGDLLFAEAKRCGHLHSLWEGNAPAASRSFKSN